MCLFESPELIENVKLIHKPVSLQPRGLINKGNWCYINAVSFHLAVCFTCTFLFLFTLQQCFSTCTAFTLANIFSSCIVVKPNTIIMDKPSGKLVCNFKNAVTVLCSVFLCLEV